MRSHGVLVNGPSPADIATVEKALDALEDELVVVVEPELPEAAQGDALDPDAHLRPGGWQAAFAIAWVGRGRGLFSFGADYHTTTTDNPDNLDLSTALLIRQLTILNRPDS